LHAKRLTPKPLAALAVTCLLAATAVGCGSSKHSTASNASGSATSNASAPASTASTGSASNGTAAKSPLTILTISGTTGPAMATGVGHYEGVQAAVAYYNAHGGIDGHKLILHDLNDNSDPSTAVSDLLKYLSENPAPVMVDAGSEAGDAAALIPVLAKHNQFAVALNDGADQCQSHAQTTCPNEFTLASSSIYPQTPPAQWFKEHGIKHVGIAEEQIDFSQSETPTFEAALKKAGISYSVASFPATALNLTPQLSQLKSDGADGVFVEALEAPAGYALAARAKLAWNTPMIFDIAASSLALTKLAPLSEVKNQAYVDVFGEMDPTDSAPGVQNLITYGKKFGFTGDLPLDTLGSGWDGVVLLAEAIKAAGGKTDTASLDAAVMKMSPTDPNRTFSHKLCFSASDHENVCGAADDFHIIPAGPIINGQVHSLH
jgi:branched-chain amino acid transport system substrate-binding protein